MRILALRVRNLTSLAGDMVLDFEAPPLAQAGLFAITGPTGAGKSTLLDALCLALYDRLPRLGHGDDVRSVLRHGAADGYAEVDFVGRDGGRYRAQWKIRRANNRPDGRLQPQTMALTDLATGAALGGGKRETQDAIADKVGLDYHQFRRSVLLAQNDFDAFLRAKPDDRAGLLELMTGTAIYGELSKAAYDRGKTEEAALKALDDELRRVNVLADDERTAVTAEAQAVEDHATRLGDEVDGLAREIDWYRVATDLRARTAEAERQVAATADAIAQAQPERDRMAQIRRALTIAPLVERADRLGEDSRRLEQEAARAAEALGQCERAQGQAAAARDAARAAEEQAEAAFKAAGPLLDRAAELDARLAEGRQRLSRYAEAVAAAQAQAEQARRNKEILEDERARCATAIAKLERWLDDNGQRRLLAEQVERWLDAVAAHGKAAAERAKAAEAYAGLRRRLGELAQQGEADAQAAEALAARGAAIAAQVESLNAQADAVDADALDRRRDGLAALDDALAAQADSVLAQDALDRRAAELNGRRRAAETRQAETEHDRTAAEQRLAAVRVALPEAQAALALAEAAQGEHALVLRARLIDGEPCPVCGAREHPVEQAHTALAGLLDAQRRRVADLEHERDDLTRRQATAAAHSRAAAETMAQADADSHRLGEERHALAARRAQAGMDVATLAERWGMALSPDIESLRTAIETERNELAERLRAARNAETERRRLLVEQEEIRRQTQLVAERLAGAAGERNRLEAELRAVQGDGERAAAIMADWAERLAEPLAALPEWRTLLRDDADGLARHLQSLAEEWRRTLADLERQRESERGLAGKCDAAIAALENSLRNAQRETRTRDDEQIALDRLAEARAQLFGGRPTAEMRTSLNDDCKVRRAEHQHAQEAWAVAAQACSAAQGRVVLLAESRAAAARAAGETAQVLAARLAEAGLEADAVREAMALGEQWMETAEARQARLREAEAAAGAVLAERRQAEAAHAAAGRPERPTDVLTGLLAERTAEHGAARDRLAQLRQRLADDDRNRGAAEETRHRIAEQRKRFDLWKGMADLIGSADGKKFRLFAQGLTLDRLLALANLHLAELTPRYVLQRAPGGDLDLQVIDRDMADEVRAVANLSGGERFLVSLALALGLASMTGSRTIAESLFIDEGFGALDAESLDVAIGALETLHAAGRKVGVISHVQPMIDRIGVQVRVNRLGGGRSVVEVRAG